jgi:hypothetical protein
MCFQGQMDYLKMDLKIGKMDMINWLRTGPMVVLVFPVFKH